MLSAFRPIALTLLLLPLVSLFGQTLHREVDRALQMEFGMQSPYMVQVQTLDRIGSDIEMALLRASGDASQTQNLLWLILGTPSLDRLRAYALLDGKAAAELRSAIIQMREFTGSSPGPYTRHVMIIRHSSGTLEVVLEGASSVRWQLSLRLEGEQVSPQIVIADSKLDQMEHLLETAIARIR